MKVLNPMELPLHARQTMQELKDKDREIETLNAKLAQNRLNDVFQNAQDVDGVKVVYALLSGTGPDGPAGPVRQGQRAGGGHCGGVRRRD